MRYIPTAPPWPKATRDQITGRTSIEVGMWAHPPRRNELVSDLKRLGSVRRWTARFTTGSGEAMEVLIAAELIELEGERCIVAQTEPAAR